MGFLRQEYWSGLPFPSPQDLPNPGIEPMSTASQVDSLLTEPPENTRLGCILLADWDRRTKQNQALIVECAAAAAARSLQSCPTLCNPIDCSPPGSPVPGILQARTLEWLAIAFSNAWKWEVKVKSLSRVRLLVSPWTAAYQAPLSMGFSRQEYWSGVPLPSPSWVWDTNK